MNHELRTNVYTEICICKTYFTRIISFLPFPPSFYLPSTYTLKSVSLTYIPKTVSVIDDSQWISPSFLPHIHKSVPDEMAGWHHQLNGHEAEQALGDGEGQGSLACCSPWCRRVRHDRVTEQKKKIDNSKDYLLPPFFYIYQKICISDRY